MARLKLHGHPFLCLNATMPGISCGLWGLNLGIELMLVRQALTYQLNHFSSPRLLGFSHSSCLTYRLTVFQIIPSSKLLPQLRFLTILFCPARGTRKHQLPASISVFSPRTISSAEPTPLASSDNCRTKHQALPRTCKTEH